MPLSEADTRVKLLDPALHARGWTEDLIRREETAGAIEIVDGKPLKQSRGRADYVLRIRAASGSQPVAVALIEAKSEDLPPGHGLEQAKGYAACKRLNVPFVFSSNGYLFVEFDAKTGLTSKPRPLAEFPVPTELRARYEGDRGFSLDDPSARPLLVPYAGGEATRRYYQFDVKAVNPNARTNQDTRTPEELLDIIESKGREVSEAVEELRKLRRDGSESKQPQ